jgi:DNA-binding NarL/FixJ family response regulator
VTGKTRVVLADDHPIVLNGLRNLIRAEADLDLVGEASSGLVALRLIHEKRPDVAVVDISMPELNGILLSRRLASELPSVRILVLTLHEDRAYVKQALDAGVSGYILKRSAAENLVQAIRAVVTGGLYVDPAIAHRIFDSSPKRTGKARSSVTAPDMTEREAEVLKLVALGFTNKEIARQLDVGVKSIETYKARGTEKLGLKTRAELVRFASAQGWLADV